MKKAFIGVAVVMAGFGVALGYMIGVGASPVGGTESGSSSVEAHSQIADLQNQLDRSQRERLQLESALELAQKQLLEKAASSGAAASPAGEAAKTAGGDVAKANKPDSAGADKSASSEDDGRGDFGGWGGRRDWMTVQYEKLTDEERAARVSDIKNKFSAAFSAGDGGKVMDLLREMNRLGPEAFPEMVALLNMVARDRSGDNTLDIGRREMFTVLGPNRDLQKYLIADTAADGSLRAAAVQTSGFMAFRATDEEKAGITESYRKLIQTDKDERVVAASASQLGRMRDSASVATITGALAVVREEETTKDLLRALGNIGTPEATQTVEYYRNNGSTEAIRQAATDALSRDPRRGGGRRGNSGGNNGGSGR